MSWGAIGRLRQRPTEKNCINRISTCRMEENAMTPAQAAQAVGQLEHAMSTEGGEAYQQVKMK